MYLDKPLRAHTLFQAVTRTNRRWTNPATGQEKLNGLIVDYVGLGQRTGQGRGGQGHRHQEGPAGRHRRVVRDPRRAGRRDAMAPFAGIDRSARRLRAVDGGAGAPQDASRTRAAFAARFLRCEALFELLWPDTRLQAHRGRLPLAGPHLRLGPPDAWTPTPCSGTGSARRPATSIGEYISDVEVEPRRGRGHRHRRGDLRGAPAAAGCSTTTSSPPGRGRRPSTRSSTPSRSACSGSWRGPPPTRSGGPCPSGWRNCAGPRRGRHRDASSS